MEQLYCCFVKEEKKMSDKINSEILFDIEFSVDGILIVEEKEE